LDTEVLLLLMVPSAFLVFGLGWLAARVDIKHLLEGARTLPRSYFRGLNYLLNEQPDRALDIFIEAVQTDPDALDLYFTLGALFRRRGESDRAIRVHQSLLVRSDLSAADIGRARYELGLDFLKAGMLDRAEESFASLRNTSQENAALAALMDVYQIEKEWQKAIEVAVELEQKSGQDLRKKIAQYYCEIAEQALALSQPGQAEAALLQAFAADRTLVRAAILAGDLNQSQGDMARALSYWLGIEQHSELHLALVAQRVMSAYLAQYQAAEGLRLLHSWLQKSASLDVLEVVFEQTLQQQGAEAAHQLLLSELKRTPTLLGLDKLVQSRLNMSQGQVREELEIVNTLLYQYARRLSRYSCSHCGFKARQFYWQCPGCQHWNSYVPRRLEELEVMS
jgi:lipopolysaccharide biosynthesis regulator YciM